MVGCVRRMDFGGAGKNFRSANARRLGIIRGFFRTEKDRDIAHLHHDFAPRLIRDLRRERLPLLLEVGEFDLHQFVLRERRIEAREESGAHPGVTEFHDGLEALRAGFEIALLRIGQGHGTPSLAAAPQGRKLRVEGSARENFSSAAGRKRFHCAPMFSLQNKIALVTGAGSGIGAAIAETFAKAGAHVFASDRDSTAAEATAQRIRDAAGRADALPLDVTDEAQCEDTARHVLAATGHLDLLVNNAGIAHVGTAATTTGADFDRVLAVNTRGVFNVTRAFLPAMLARRHGVIVNLASIAGVIAVRDRFAYTVSKHAVVGLTRAMALDHARDGIRVNAICPGRVETPFVAQILANAPDPAALRAEMTSTQPMGRMGTPLDIAYAALYLASDEAAFVTGTTLCPDGGWSAG